MHQTESITVKTVQLITTNKNHSLLRNKNQ